jgi:hypothetical protein
MNAVCRNPWMAFGLRQLHAGDGGRSRRTAERPRPGQGHAPTRMASTTRR